MYQLRSYFLSIVSIFENVTQKLHSFIGRVSVSLRNLHQLCLTNSTSFLKRMCMYFRRQILKILSGDESLRN